MGTSVARLACTAGKKPTVPSARRHATPAASHCLPTVSSRRARLRARKPRRHHASMRLSSSGSSSAERDAAGVSRCSSSARSTFESFAARHSSRGIAAPQRRVRSARREPVSEPASASAATPPASTASAASHVCCQARAATAAQTRPHPGPNTATVEETNAAHSCRYVDATCAFVPSAQPGVSAATSRAPASPPRANGGASFRKNTLMSVGNSSTRKTRRSNAFAPPGTSNRYTRVAVTET